MDPESLKTLANYGMPAVMAGYLMVYVTRSLNGKFRELSDELRALRGALERLADKIEQYLDIAP